MVKKQYESPIIPLQVGDVITSKLGFIMQAPITKEWFEFKKQKYIGNGKWEIIGDKIPVDVKQKV